MSNKNYIVDNSEFNYPGQYASVRVDYFAMSQREEWLIDGVAGMIPFKMG